MKAKRDPQRKASKAAKSVVSRGRYDREDSRDKKRLEDDMHNYRARTGAVNRAKAVKKKAVTREEKKRAKHNLKIAKAKRTAASGLGSAWTIESKPKAATRVAKLKAKRK